MSLIAQNAVGVHVVRVKTPDGNDHDLAPCDVRRALRIARMLCGWFGVDD